VGYILIPFVYVVSEKLSGIENVEAI